MTKKFVLAISGMGANDAIRGMVEAYTDPIAALGLSIVHVSTDDAELRYATEQIAAGNVAFGITWLGIGQYLPVDAGNGGARVNAWEAFHTPLLKIHGDIPAYFQDVHRDIPANAVNLYPASEFVAFRRRWMPDAQALTALIPPLVLAPIERPGVDVARRRSGKLVFLKNGNSPVALRELWRERLPASVARLVGSMADAIEPVGMRAGPLFIGDFVADFIASEKIEPGTMRRMVPFLTAQMDDYLRRVKSTMIATALLDLPVIVQGDQWEHVDFRNRRATRVPGQDYARSQLIYTEQLGIVDMSPNIDTGGHERVQRAAGSFALPITNRQGWIERALPGFDDLMFEFTPESIASRVADVVANPDRYLELALAFGDRFREAYPVEAYANRVIDLAELAVLQYGEGKPSVQPFFIWPRA
ncbi:MAG: hypothetical protein U1F15_14730 [Burkholderiales bacterium]